MQEKYLPKKIEEKWQYYWEKNKTYKSEVDSKKPKYYVLDMFPYPSGSGLHVGHPVGYTATDILARYKRMKGFNVLHPMGWDSFGLPAEQYAVRTGVHPALTTERNIENIKKQLKQLGFSYDWDREIKTSDPTYYKWTQWIFTKLYEKELAYEAEQYVNFCPELGTVLANEEIENGRSKEGGFLVEKRPLRQWVLKITAYAERLLQDLEDLDWPESLKRHQRNWIGKSQGAKIYFKEKKSEEIIPVFTTSHDTIFGVTFIVLAPEHPLSHKIASPEQRPSVEAYIHKVRLKSDLDRTELAKEKTGVWTGAYAINPVNGEEIPIWIADYVLVSYGTGAVMGVPAHDERDREFAHLFNLPIIPVIEEGVMIQSQSDLNLNGLTPHQAKEEVVQFLEKTGNGERAVSYKLRDWLFSRQRYWGEPFPILHFEDGTKRTLDLDELPLIPPHVQDYKPSPSGDSALAKVPEWVHITDPKTHKKAQRETNTMPQWAGSCWYYLRFLDPQNDHEAWSLEKEKYWMPVDLYVGGAEHAVLHLLYARFWHKVLFDLGLVSTSEPFKALRNQGLVLAHSYKIEGGAYVSPKEVYENNGQYYHKETNTPLISQVDKMSKSKLNGVSPDEIIEEFGADALRLYTMFLSPLEKEKVWDTQAVSGCLRFLQRFWDLSWNLSDEEPSKDALKIGHTLIKGIQEDIENLMFNTAISKFMTFINDFSKLEQKPKSIFLEATLCLYSFAPHITSEIWENLGGVGEISYAPFPLYQEAYLIEDSVTYVIQINGKVRGRLDLPPGKKKEELIQLARENANVAKYLEGHIEKAIFVPNKLINFVVA